MSFLNPFLYGKPVPPARFIGRREVLRTVFSRLHHGDSTALIGLPHFGKSSVLRYLDSSAVREEWLGAAAAALQVVQVDCHGLLASAQPGEFWQSLVDAVLTFWGDDPVVKQAAAAAHSAAYSPQSLTRLFGQTIGDKGRRVALLLDEVEVLLHHPHFCRADFLGLLRSLTTRTDGLVLLLASRMSLSQMNRLSAEVNRGSPFFNNCIEVPLAPLSAAEIQQLLDTCLMQHPAFFQSADYALVIEQSGGQPYLVQATAAALFAVIGQGVPAGPARAERALAALHQQIGSYFDTLWQHLDGRLRQTLLAVVLGAQAKESSAPRPSALAVDFSEQQRLRQLGLLVPGSPQRDGSLTSDTTAGALSAWLTVHAVATAKQPSASLWDSFIGSPPEAGHESAMMRHWVLEHAGSAQYVALSALLAESFDTIEDRRPGQPARTPTLESLRKLLQSLLFTASELDRFCLDHFKQRVFERFTSDMERTVKTNLLLQCVGAEEILARLAGDFPQELRDRQHLLRYE